jgi:hypothetical protein
MFSAEDINSKVGLQRDDVWRWSILISSEIGRHIDCQIAHTLKYMQLDQYSRENPNLTMEAELTGIFCVLIENK